MKVLVTGVLGFIGHAVARRLVEERHDVTGLDRDQSEIKRARLEDLRPLIMEGKMDVLTADVCDRKRMYEIMAQRGPFTHVLHLAAEAGVQRSWREPQRYILTNVSGFQNILDVCAQPEYRPKHLVYASSSSIYGNGGTPNNPVSIYAATKRMNELQAEVYRANNMVTATGLRYFTVYGPWMRPDLAISKFTAAIFQGLPITLFNKSGETARDYTYIDDAVDATIAVMKKPCSFPTFDVGCGQPTSLTDMFEELVGAIGKTAFSKHEAIPLGDVKTTRARPTELYLNAGVMPRTSLRDGLRKFVRWYAAHHGIRHVFPDGDATPGALDLPKFLRDDGRDPLGQDAK